MRIDAHLHYVSPRVFAALRRDPSRYGVAFSDAGGVRVQFPGEPPPRPVLPTLYDLAALRAHRARHGLDGLVVGPVMDLEGYSLPPEQGAALSRLVNESLAADLDGETDLWGLATVPLQAPDAAAAELHSAVRDLGLRGAMIDTHVGGRALSELALDPFWAAAQALAVPVVLHPFAVPPVERFDRYYLHNVIGYPMETTLAAAGLIFGGVLRRFPGLRVVLVHGGGFLPYQIGRLQRAYHAREEARAHLDSPPEGFLRAFWYDSLTHGAAALQFLVAQVGADRVLLGSDFPFGMADPEPLRVLEAANLPAAARRAIAGENAAALFGIGSPAPRPGGKGDG
ncbi:MAG: amidohydrolase family protein [Armatimonadota bacterium]|nr:amidohydrolase family protein [Armatimonadota bacterium]MDR7532043.1 amidohydrolase family protein [Armatimonadota bacterium]MDR7535974.1 amidohydrolase family protein [Armatimonadota bacterium]